MTYEMFLCDDARVIEQFAVAPLQKKPNRTVSKPRLPVASGISWPASSGIAWVQSRGPTSKYGSKDSLSTIYLTDVIKAATAQDDVSLIVLEIDSPGGSVLGTEELANAIAAAAKVKTVITLVDGMCCSAAYWYGSQATKVYAQNKTDMIGSIGTVMAVVDITGALDRSGVKVHRIRSGPLKGIAHPGTSLSEDEHAYLTKGVKIVTDEFIKGVSVGRGIPMDQVRQMATGAAFFASEALRLGLIDGFMTADEIIASHISSQDRQMHSFGQSHRALKAIVADYTAKGMGELQARELAAVNNPRMAAEAKQFLALPADIRSKYLPKKVQKDELA